ncbi:hypothetical protein ACRAWD_00855 [Caulobacter segnis]
MAVQAVGMPATPRVILKPVLLENTRQVFRGAELLEAGLGIAEHLVDHLLVQLGPRVDPRDRAAAFMAGVVFTTVAVFAADAVSACAKPAGAVMAPASSMAASALVFAIFFIPVPTVATLEPPILRATKRLPCCFRALK